ncbi:MAG: ABC transporter ATP-binding protein [Clostridium sp.]|nr:ABC transporter ATP-binding protein [Clostridium sp.]
MTNYLKRIFALSDKGAKDLFKASICCTLTNISLMLPVTIMYFLLQDLLLPLTYGSGKLPGVTFYLVVSVVVLVIIFILNYIQYNATFLASYRESANKRISLAEHLRKIPLSFFGNRDLADLTTTIMGDCAGLEKAFSHYIPELFGSIASVILIGIGLFIMDWRLSIALLWVIPVAFLITAGGKKQQDKVNILNKMVSLKCSDGIQECIETVKEIKSNNLNDKYLKDLEEKFKWSEKIQMKAELNSALFVVTAQMLLRLGIATTVLVGGFLLTKGSVDLLTFLMFLVAATRVFDPLSSSLINLSAIFGALLQINRMKEIETQPIQKGSDKAIYRGYDITFDNVGFAYNNSETVLKDVSFVAKQGEVTALVGPSGGGKSTALKLAARFWDVTKGSIKLGGTDISYVDPEALLENISIVFQDVVLFNNSIMENIRLGRRGATDEEVYAAARAAQCEEFIERLPEGYNTRIGENGAILSGGERQRISIARALLKDAPVIFLDEATASLDVENESIIQKAISNLIEEKTVLVIAHRMRTIANADKIVVLAEGRVKEIGTPEVLIKEDGIYKNMVELQKESANWSIA